MKKLWKMVNISIILLALTCYFAVAEESHVDAVNDPNILWRDDFSDFKKSEKFYWDERDKGVWVLRDSELNAEPLPGSGITCVDISGRGYTGMTRKFFKYHPAYRYFQLKLANIGKEPGYRFTIIGIWDGSGKSGKRYKGAVKTSRPGIYTVDTHYISPNYRSGKDKACFLKLWIVGSKKTDGTIKPGPTFTFDWLQLVKQPVNGLAVTMADGSPLGDSVKKGDRLLFQLYLEQPAKDVSIELFTDYTYTPLLINGEPYVQLKKADGKIGKVWKSEVAIGGGTGKYDQEKSGYPVLFKAVIAGGEIDETYASAFVSFE